MIIKTYKRHLPALLIMILTIGSWIALLPSLPNPLTVYCSFSKVPVFAGEPIVPFIAMCGFMTIAHVIIVFLDLILFARVVPGYIMAAVDWIVEGTAGIIYLSILGGGVGLIPGCTAGLVGGGALMLIVLGALYRRARESVEKKAGPLFNSPYFERVRASLLMRVFFFLSPLFPSYIVIIPEGIRVIGVFYDVTYPWDRIEALKEGNFLTFLSNRPIKLNHTISNTVEIRLKDRRNYPLISVAERGLFLETAAKFMAGG